MIFFLLFVISQEKKKQEKKEALRMLKELKTVMGVRAQEREEREKKAILRMKGEVGEDTEEKKETEETGGFGLRKRLVNDKDNDGDVTMFCTRCNASNVGGGDQCSCSTTASLLDTESSAMPDHDKAWDDLTNKPYKPPRPRIEVGDEQEDEDSLEKRRERLGKVVAGGQGLAFQLNLAAVAAARGQQFGVQACEDTFGDSDEGDCVIEG